MTSPPPTPHQPDGSRLSDACQTTVAAVLAAFPGARHIGHRRLTAQDLEAEARRLRAQQMCRRLEAMSPAEALSTFAQTQTLVPYKRYPRSRAPPSRARALRVPVSIPRYGNRTHDPIPDR